MHTSDFPTNVFPSLCLLFMSVESILGTASMGFQVDVESDCLHGSKEGDIHLGVWQ